MASFKAKFPVLQELFAKNHRGGAFAPPPPSGARVKAGRCGIHFTLLGCKLKMMGCYIQFFSYYKGVQSGQIAPLFGGGSGVIWPIFLYLEVGNRAVTFGNWLGVLRGERCSRYIPSKSFWIRISHLAHFLHNPVGAQLCSLGVLRHSQRDIKVGTYSYGRKRTYIITCLITYVIGE